MTSLEWLLFFLAIQLIHSIGTFKLYEKAGRKKWESLIPIYNAIILMQIIKRPKWWVILLFIPVINLIMFCVVWVEILRSFGRNTSKDIILGIVTLGLYIYIVNFDSKSKYIGDRDLKEKTWFGQWISAVLFAVIAATIVHNYFIQPFIIPTGSLEKTLLIGDFLFVSKFHYGARTPTSAIAFPMVHDTIPILGIRSYLKKPQLPHFRFLGLKKVKRNDIVVFNWPADTVRRFFVKEKGVHKPIDKKSNYVKRCVGMPGDTLQIINGFVHINGTKNVLPYRAKLQYNHFAYNSKGIPSKNLLNEGIKNFTRKYKVKNLSQNSYNEIKDYILGVYSNKDNSHNIITRSKGIPAKVFRELRLGATEILDTKKILTLTLDEAKRIQKKGITDSVVRKVDLRKIANTNLFPNTIPFNWNEDNFGPILIPRKGITISLNETNLPLYKRIIREYEGNTLTKKGNTIFINDKETSSYTFKENYYWMMGDNRHASEDSRYWGYVPENHIVGKPILIWFSIDGINDGIKNWEVRWDRLMTTVQGKGDPYSFFPIVLTTLISLQLFVFIRRKVKKKS